MVRKNWKGKGKMLGKDRKKKNVNYTMSLNGKTLTYGHPSRKLRVVYPTEADALAAFEALKTIIPQGLITLREGQIKRP